MQKLLLAISVTVAVAANARAQDWPARPITLVLPYAAGGPVDVVGRLMAPRMSELIGQPIIIENVPGAGGVTGVTRVAKAAPDGYQFVLSAAGTFAHSPTFFKRLPYNPSTDFVSIGLDRGGAADPAGPQGPSGPRSQGVRRLHQGEPGQDAVRLGRSRFGGPYHVRAPELRLRHQHHPRALSRHQRRLPGPDLRPGRLHVRLHRKRVAADSKRFGQGDRDAHARTHVGAARSRHRARAGRCRLRRAGLVCILRPEGNARRHRPPPQQGDERRARHALRWAIACASLAPSRSARSAGPRSISRASSSAKSRNGRRRSRRPESRWTRRGHVPKPPPDPRSSA